MINGATQFLMSRRVRPFEVAKAKCSGARICWALGLYRATFAAVTRG